MCCQAAGLEDAIEYLIIAEKDFSKLEIYQALLDVQYLISVVYHNLGMEKERDLAGIRHSVTTETANRVQSAGSDREAEEILQTVASVGAALASRQ